MRETSYTVGQLARISGVTVRTLHHYDEIGLLTPSERAGNGYRRYAVAELDRLQRILTYRELGFALDEIADLLDGRAPADEQLRHQLRLLEGRVAQLQRMAAMVRRTIEARTMKLNLTPEERFAVFGDADPHEHAEEAARRWGDGDAYRESQRRVGSYDQARWTALRDQQEQLFEAQAAACRAGLPADGERALELAEQHRRFVDRWFHPTTRAAQAQVGELFVADPRFTAFYERRQPGLAAWVRDSYRANAARGAAGED